MTQRCDTERKVKYVSAVCAVPQGDAMILLWRSVCEQRVHLKKIRGAPAARGMHGENFRAEK